MPLLADGLHNSRHALRFWATLIHWLLPTSSMLSLHLLWVSLLLGFLLWGVHSDVILAHLVLLILATCPVHCPLMHHTLSIISFTPVLHLIISFRILSLFVMFNNNLFIQLIQFMLRGSLVKKPAHTATVSPEPRIQPPNFRRQQPTSDHFQLNKAPKLQTKNSIPIQLTIT